ncbi:MAG: hypothetical protein CL807_10120 [Citromicrobium sp.]|nr:hypothetical protein [Citromicrobium sp.]MAO96741.1 hypothetical protein [Citromicrobium sp.]MBD77214.1 hypothetical protein [Citromicrobium sp.]MBT46672.1 hypothetical protein [Citromicrobium sp.]
MKRFGTLAFAMIFGVSACASTAPSVAQSPSASRLVHGLLDAHWEYPNFLPDDVEGETALPFYFEEERWREIYARPVIERQRDRPEETVCFRVVGYGYVAPRKRTTMWPATRQFVFTKVVEMTQLPSGVECQKRFRQDGD